MKIKELKKEIIKYIKEINNGFFDKKELYFLKEITIYNKVDNIDCYLENVFSDENMSLAVIIFYNKIHFWLNQGWKIFEYWYEDEVNLIFVEKSEILNWEFHWKLIEETKKDLHLRLKNGVKLWKNI